MAMPLRDPAGPPNPKFVIEATIAVEAMDDTLKMVHLCMVHNALAIADIRQSAEDKIVKL